MDGGGSEARAQEFHELLLEILRRLNRSAERAGSVEGLEMFELDRALTEFWSRWLVPVELPQAVELLAENGLVRVEDDPVYAWDRRRTLGRRYLITSLGKSYLLRQIDQSGRVR